MAEVWAKGGEGALDLADKVTAIADASEKKFTPLYADSASIKEKIETIAKEIYGAKGVVFGNGVLTKIKKIEDLGFGAFPVCMAKTQYSLSDDPKLLGRPSDFEINVRDIYVSAGAGFVVALTGDIMTMPGLPASPAAYRIDVDENNKITGLF